MSREALAIAREFLPERHALTARAALGLAQALKASGEVAEAQPLALEAFRFRTELMPAGAWQIAEANRLVQRVRFPAKSSFLDSFPAHTNFLSRPAANLHLHSAKPMPSLQEVRQIAKEAFIYGFPLVTNYQTLYKQAVDFKDPDYREPFNVVGRSQGVATPEDKFVVTPNSDTPYSYLWLDLRAEPVVVTMPKIEKDRYYSGQLIDLYTFNFAYLGSRTRGNDGGNFLIAGPGWSGAAPGGVQAVLRCETEFAYLLFRTQLFNSADLENVKQIQNGYNANLSASS